MRFLLPLILLFGCAACQHGKVSVRVTSQADLQATALLCISDPNNEGLLCTDAAKYLQEQSTDEQKL